LFMIHFLSFSQSSTSSSITTQKVLATSVYVVSLQFASHLELLASS